MRGDNLARPSSGDKVSLRPGGYCVKQVAAGANTVHFSSTSTNCFGTGGTALTSTVADTIVGLQWQVPTSINGTTSFDFCIDHLTPLTQ